MHFDNLSNCLVCESAAFFVCIHSKCVLSSAVTYPLISHAASCSNFCVLTNRPFFAVIIRIELKSLRPLSIKLTKVQAIIGLTIKTLKRHNYGNRPHACQLVITNTRGILIDIFYFKYLFPANKQFIVILFIKVYRNYPLRAPSSQHTKARQVFIVA